jgi:hypothetical protein
MPGNGNEPEDKKMKVTCQLKSVKELFGKLGRGMRIAVVGCDFV